MGFHALCVLNADPDVNDNDSSKSLLRGSSSQSQSSPNTGGSKQYQSYALPPGHAVCTFQDGGVGLYDLRKRKWDFLRELVKKCLPGYFSSPVIGISVGSGGGRK